MEEENRCAPHRKLGTAVQNGITRAKSTPSALMRRRAEEIRIEVAAKKLRATNEDEFESFIK